MFALNNIETRYVKLYSRLVGDHAYSMACWNLKYKQLRQAHVAPSVAIREFRIKSCTMKAGTYEFVRHDIIIATASDFKSHAESCITDWCAFRNRE